MTYRIITHGNCSDGFASAYFFKKYWQFLAPSLSQEDIDNAEIIGLQPYDIQSGEFEFTEQDIVLDLPKPDSNIFFWCDHHSSNKVDTLQENEHWCVAPGNAGLLLDIAVKNGLTLNDELTSFKKNTDIMDAAEYTREMIEENFYPSESYESPSDLLKLHMIGAMFHTRDGILNEVVFKTLLSKVDAPTPLTSTALWNLNPLMFFKAQLKGFAEWRAVVDEYIEYNEESKCTVQDDKLAEKRRGVADRFYAIMKFPQTSYTFLIREKDDKARIGIGSNIFHKDRCKVDIGALCKKTAEKFGTGSGGGHFYVGGATINAEHYDEAKEYVLTCLKEDKIIE